MHNIKAIYNKMKLFPLTQGIIELHQVIFVIYNMKLGPNKQKVLTHILCKTNFPTTYNISCFIIYITYKSN